MSTDLATLIFPYEGDSVRIITRDGDPWFVATDVCRILDIGRPQDTVRYLDDDEKRTCPLDTPSGRQAHLIVSEAGLYSLILRSRKPEAKTFKRWVTHDVLPAIRRTGRYETAPAIPQTYAEALRAAADAIEAKESAEQHARALEPRAAVTDALIATTGDYSLREAAQILSRDHGITTGQNRLLASIRELQWIDSSGRPYQRVIDAGWLTTRIQTYDHPKTGEPTLAKPQIRITTHGITRLHTLLTTSTPGDTR